MARQAAVYGSVLAKDVWVPTRVVMGILQISGHAVTMLRAHGQLSHNGKRPYEYNLAEVLERYRVILRTQGELLQELEANCIREFEKGRTPKDVIIEKGYAYATVKDAWDHYIELSAHPAIARIDAERQQANKMDEASRCRECARTKSVSAEDTRTIAREVTGDHSRDDLNMLEERAAIGLDIRCPQCRMLKATLNVEQLRARLRTLRIMGMPKPIDVDKEMPLPPVVSAEPAAPAPPAAALGDLKTLAGAK